MNNEITTSTTLADSICDIRARKIKKVFFEQINTLLYRQSISLHSISKNTIKKVKALLASRVMMDNFCLKYSNV